MSEFPYYHFNSSLLFIAVFGRFDFISFSLMRRNCHVKITILSSFIHLSFALFALCVVWLVIVVVGGSIVSSAVCCCRDCGCALSIASRLWSFENVFVKWNHQKMPSLFSFRWIISRFRIISLRFVSCVCYVRWSSLLGCVNYNHWLIAGTMENASLNGIMLVKPPSGQFKCYCKRDSKKICLFWALDWETSMSFSRPFFRLRVCIWERVREWKPCERRTFNEWKSDSL